MVAVVRARKGKGKMLDLMANTQSKLFMVAQLDDASVPVITPQLNALKKRNVSMHWVKVANKTER